MDSQFGGYGFREAMGAAWKEHRQTAHSLFWVPTYSCWEVWDRWDDLIATWHLKAVEGNLEIKNQSLLAETKDQPQKVLEC